MLHIFIQFERNDNSLAYVLQQQFENICVQIYTITYLCQFIELII